MAAMVCLISTFIFVSCNWSEMYSGSKIYEIKMTSKELIDRIKRLKEREPDLNVWSTRQDGALYNLDKVSFTYYHLFYFNLKVAGKDAIGMIVVDSRNNLPVILKFHVITYSKNLGDWVRIKELPRKERKEVVAAFEKQILNRILRNY